MVWSNLVIYKQCWDLTTEEHFLLLEMMECHQEFFPASPRALFQMFPHENLLSCCLLRNSDVFLAKTNVSPVFSSDRNVTFESFVFLEYI